MSAADTTPASSGTASAGTDTTPARRGGMRRRDAVLGGVLLGGALFGTTRATWLHATVPDLAGGTSSVVVGGDQAAPAVVALAVVGIATSLAMAISSPVVRFVTGPVLVLCGLGAAVGALLVQADPPSHVSGAVADSTGLLGATAAVTLTPWPLISLVPAALLAVLGILVVWRGSGWRRTARYDRDARPQSAVTATGAATADGAGLDPLEDPSAAWDALTRGEDPSDGRRTSEGPGVATTDEQGAEGAATTDTDADTDADTDPATRADEDPAARRR